MNTGQAVLALDDLLCNATPEEAAAVRALAPTWLADQIHAASTHIQTNLDLAAAAGEINRYKVSSPQDHPDWVRLSVLDGLIQWINGTNTTCLHAPHPMRPQPVFAAAWKPGLVVCGQCSHLLRAPTRVADRTCDSCGRVTDGPEHNDPMWPFSVTAGVLTYMLGVCTHCRYWETAA